MAKVSAAGRAASALSCVIARDRASCASARAASSSELSVGTAKSSAASDVRGTASPPLSEASCSGVPWNATERWRGERGWSKFRASQVRTAASASAPQTVSACGSVTSLCGCSSCARRDAADCASLGCIGSTQSSEVGAAFCGVAGVAFSFVAGMASSVVASVAGVASWCVAGMASCCGSRVSPAALGASGHTRDFHDKKLRASAVLPMWCSLRLCPRCASSEGVSESVLVSLAAMTEGPVERARSSDSGRGSRAWLLMRASLSCRTG